MQLALVHSLDRAVGICAHRPRRDDRVEGLPVQRGRAHAGHLVPRHDGAAADVDDGLHHVRRRSGHDHDANPPVDPVAGGEPRDRVLGGLVEPEVGEEGSVGHAAVGPQHVPGRLDLGRVERVQRMGGVGPRCRWCRVDRHAGPSPAGLRSPSSTPRTPGERTTPLVVGRRPLRRLTYLRNLPLPDANGLQPRHHPDRVRAALDRALLGRRRALLLAAAALVGQPESVGRGRARRALRPRRDHGGRVSRAAPRPEGRTVGPMGRRHRHD